MDRTVRAKKEYDGTIESLPIRLKTKIRLFAQKERLEQYLEYYYKHECPSRGALWRWAKEGVPKLPHEKPGGVLRGNERVRSRLKKKMTFSNTDRSIKYRNDVDWAKAAWRRLRSKAKQKGMAFNLTYKDLIPPKTCPVLGIELVIGGGRSYESQKNSPSVDRFDNSLGYLKENIRIISKRANSIKSDATAEEMSAVLAYMRS